MKSEVRSQTNGVRTICAPSGEFLSARKSNAQCGQECPHSVRAASRNGATLLVTLGILAMLSVIIVGFFVSSRLSSQAGASDKNRATARNQIDEAVHLAMRFVEESMTYPNYTGENFIESTDFDAYDNKLNQHRLAPAGSWFTAAYSETNGFDTTSVTYQGIDVLTSPTLLDTPEAYVNLFTPQVLRLLPSLLTNEIARVQESGTPLVSGWHEIEPVIEDNKEIKLLANPSRIAFALVNGSSLFDANYFGGGPSAEKRAAICFSQPDVTNWLNGVAGTSIFTNLTGIANFDYTRPEESPFGFLSYDPAPDTYPLHYDCFETSPTLGRHAFNAWPDINLNQPGTYEELQALFMSRHENGNYWKFSINSITNFCQVREAGGGLSFSGNTPPWHSRPDFRLEWLEPVTFYLNLSLHEEPIETVHRIPNFSAFAWAVANQIDADRVPKVSEFPTPDNPDPGVYSRADYAVKDVPLINKVHVFNIFADEEDVLQDTGGGAVGGNQNLLCPKPPSYYGLMEPGLSNHYAVAIELWYPFAPQDPPPETWCYVGVVTNVMDALTTTNRPWTSEEMEDWLRWADAGRSNTVMQLLFEQWGQEYRRMAGSQLLWGGPDEDGDTFRKWGGWVRRDPGNPWDEGLVWVEGWTHQSGTLPLWITVTDQQNLWFTEAMPGHPSWPLADTNGVPLIRETTIYRALYETNSVTATNYFIAWRGSYLDENDEEVVFTNKLTRVSDDTEGIPVLGWQTLDGAGQGGAVTNWWLVSAQDGGGHTVLFGENPSPPPYETNRLWSLSIELGREEVVLSVSNDPSGTFTVYTNASLELWTPLPGGGSTNVFVTPFLAQEDIQTPPLPREGDRGEDLTYLWDMMDELFVLLEEPQDRASLYALLMLRAGDDGWEDILNNVFLPFFNNNLSSVNRTLRSHQMPARFGGKVGENYIALEDSASGFDPDTVDAADCRASTETYGIYYTVYPRNFVCFPEIESVPILDATGQETGEENVVTNYFRLGSKAEYHLWVNPAVALEGEYLHAGDDKVGHVYLDNGEERGCIVDEALLTNRPDQEYPPIEWSNVGVSYIPDPRRNAWAERWLFEYGGGSVGQTPGEEGGLIPPREFMHYDVPERVAADLEAYSWATKELPFIQWGAPLHSIGDLGDTYIPYRPDYHMVIDDATGTATRMSDLRYDTVTFSTRSGGALLDMFTLAPTNGPRTRYGLVQPNTELDPVIKTLFSDVTIGWTNTLDTTTQLPLKEAADMDALTELYAGSVITAPFGMGWRTFADMMPSLLATNRVLNDDFTAERTALDETRRALEDELRQGRHQMHDYLEDAMRGLIDKVSFRQNIYMVVVAAQTLSRSSTLARPVVLADQRALVTVIRDAWSGRWVIHDWKWLTE